MKKIIVIRGNSGSGKSTIANEVLRKFDRGNLLIPQDFVRRQMLWVKDGPNNKSVSLFNNMIEYGFNNCDIVILEGIFVAEWYMEVFKKIKELYKDNVYAYYLDVDFEETLKRHVTKPNCKDFGEKEMREWWREKDLVPIFNEKLIPQELTLTQTVDFIVQDVQK